MPKKKKHGKRGKKHGRGRPMPSKKEQRPEEGEGKGKGCQPERHKWYEEGVPYNERDDDFSKTEKTVEAGFGPVKEIGFGSDDDVLNHQEKKRKNCDKLLPFPCYKFLHNSEFYGVAVGELYKVKIILNKEVVTSLKGRLYGVIETNPSDEVRERITYFSVKKENATPINLDNNNNTSINLPLSCPRSRPCTFTCCCMEVYFAFKFETEDGKTINAFEEDLQCPGRARVHEVFEGDDDPPKWGMYGFTPQSYTDRGSVCHISRKMIHFPNSDLFRVAAYVGIYDGVWAYIDVKILKEGVRKFYGFIYARSCIFYSRIPLLSVESNQMCELHPSRSVELARPVVAIPSFSSLVVEALLYDQDGEVIVRDKTFFKASLEGTASGQIGKGRHIGKGSVRIQVKWEYTW